MEIIIIKTFVGRVTISCLTFILSRNMVFLIILQHFEAYPVRKQNT